MMTANHFYKTPYKYKFEWWHVRMKDLEVVIMTWNFLSVPLLCRELHHSEKSCLGRIRFVQAEFLNFCRAYKQGPCKPVWQCHYNLHQKQIQTKIGWMTDDIKYALYKQKHSKPILVIVFEWCKVCIMGFSLGNRFKSLWFDSFLNHWTRTARAKFKGTRGKLR